MKHLYFACLCAILFLPVFSSAQTIKTQVWPVVAGTDDAEEAAPGGSGTAGDMDLTSSDLEIMLDGTKKQFIGVRFRNIAIPAGATINRAYIQFATKGDKAAVSGIATITTQDADNATAFTATPFDISARTKTSSSVSWAGSTSSTWGTTAGGTAGADQRTPDLKTVLQPVINRAGWASGNALVFMLSGEGVRNAFSYDGSAAAAPKLIVEYTAAAIPAMAVSAFPLTANSEWKYNDSGTDLGASWLAPAYDDAAWSYGPGKLGYSDNAVTTLSYGPNASNKYITYYFRKQFTLANVAALLDSLKLTVLRDDGAIIYINGTEVVRSNMPAGAVNYQTFSSAIVDGADESTYFAYTISKNVLVNGVNTIAVEVHQRDGTSSDLGFDLTLQEHTPAVMSYINFPIPANSDWKYLDNGTDQGTAWTALAYSDAAWKFGYGKLGYNDNAVTVLNYGPDANNKYITYYFRKKFKVANTLYLADSVELRLLRDDGAVVYLNGAEVVRSNMPSGTVNHLTPAAAIVDGAEESAYFTYRLPKSVLVNDSNILAVEIHQRDGTSSDLGFDLSLQPYTPAVVCTPATGPHISAFTSVLPTAQPDSLRIPATHTFQVLLQSGEPYTNPADGVTKSTFDFTGYVPIGGSSTNGYLSINHEGGSWPSAGVSMLSLNYTNSNQLWNITNNAPVNFGLSALSGTGRNCSGTVTPWGTIITCEETLPTADANGDGYQDIGWAVEIDPATHAVKDQNGDGNPDKLWKLGRMSHENVVVAPDQKTVYEGNDENPGYIFKLVADVPGQLGSGNLFVLKLAGTPDNASGGEWIQVPNNTPAECNNVRAFAASVAATNFNSIEDVEISPLDGRIYFTSKASSRVYRFKDNGTTVNQFGIFVGNAATIYNITHSGGTASEAWGDGNDNLTFDDKGNLYVLQDGGRNHIWMVKPCHTAANPSVELFAVTPAGSEPTGMTFSPDFKFMFVSIQHPSGANATQMRDATGNAVRFNKESAIVIARREFLGGVNNAPLPIRFISFTAARNSSNGVNMEWEYSSDEPTARFDVQRMTGGGFETIGTVTANGVTALDRFTYTDASPVAGRNFYRIRVVQASGQEVLTAIKAISFEAGAFSIVHSYPNPVLNSLTLQVDSRTAKQVQVQVFSANGGQALLTQQVAIAAGNSTLRVDAASLATGVYIVRLTAGGESVQTRFIKQ